MGFGGSIFLRAGMSPIAVVPAEGAITMAPGGLLDSGGITAKALTKTLRTLAKDDAVKVVVLRIDSPGAAEGRIWSGQQGFEKKLADELGGLSRSLEVARSLGKLDERAPVVGVGRDESLFETLLLGDSAEAEAVERAVVRVTRACAPLAGAASSDVRPSVAARSPLLSDETALTTLPFALVVR